MVFTTMQKGAIGIKNTRMAISKVQMRKKVFFMKTWKRRRLDLTFTRFRTFFLGFFFLRIYFPPDFIFCDLISWDFIESPHTILGKIVPGIQNTGLYSSYIFFPRTWENSNFFSQSFYFQVFFQKLFFPGLSYIDSFDSTLDHDLLSHDPTALEMNFFFVY